MSKNKCRKKRRTKMKIIASAWLRVLGGIAILAILLVCMSHVFGWGNHSVNLVTDNIVMDGDIWSYDDGKIMSVTGIDVSVFQREIDWDAVRNEGISFAMIRSGYRTHQEGAMNQDSKFKENLQGALDAGIDVGIYFYSQAVTEEEAKEEAQFVINQIKDYSITYPVAFDMEYTYDHERIKALSREELTSIAKSFCETIKTAGYTPMVYGNHTWLSQNIELDRLNDYYIWIADYSDNLSFPERVKMWQYTNKGNIQGIQTKVDLNLFLIYN